MADGPEVVPRNLPFRAEYAKSGRARCKSCGVEIEKDELRLAIMVKSFRFDGFTPNWYHFKCFFLRAKPQSVGDISHFESLRWEDQKRIKDKIANLSTGSATPGSGKVNKQKLKDFSVEYAKSSRANCVACEKPIEKQDLRVGKKDHTSETAARFGPLFRWHHLDCFVKIREHLEFFESGRSLPGYRDLEQEDKELIKSKLPEIKPNNKRKLGENGDVAAKKVKTENGNGKSEEDIKREKLIEKQNKAMYRMRDEIVKAADEKQITKRELQYLFEYNKQEIPSGSSMYDRLADIMTFGALLPCEKCKTGQYVYRSGVGYQCMGHLTEFTKCGNITENPKRMPFKIPKDLQVEDIPFLKNYKPKVEDRVIPKHEKPTVVASTSSAVAGTSGYKGPKINATPLKNFRFFIDPSLDKDALTKKIQSFGGKVASSIKSIAAIISTPEKVEAGKEKFIKTAKEKKIPVVSQSFVDNLRDVDYNIVDQIQLASIVDWIKPADVEPHLKSVNKEFMSASNEVKSKLEREMKTVKLKMKDGAVVDPDSGLEDEGHVYKEGSTYYAFVLSKVDVEEGENKFYKLQLIESDKGKRYWVFRAWGRLGTTIGGNQCDEMGSKEEALKLFHKMYKEKTGNVWGKPFVKKPGYYTPMDIDFGGKKQMEKLQPDTKSSKLELPVQKLICKIFDVEDMQRTLLEFELDLSKMPLGKMSKAQILQAYSILSETSKLLEGRPKKENFKKQLVDVTNRFFTLVPHSFGTADPPLLDSLDLVKAKCEMLENMMEVEIAYELLMTGEKEGESRVDTYYKKLKCNISTLEKSSQMWQILEKYLVNTHADTHDFRLDIENIYAVDRKGEEKKYAKYKDLHNRIFLWHGSRTTNFAGILSQGLRIAPPEAPATGYMFGKGIYFADMVSKSAQYCHPNWTENAEGLLLLCEVALGDMAEYTDAKPNLTKPPKGKHSVKGVGQTEPDPKEKLELPTGTVVPYGKPVPAPVKRTSLLYNEYIVYDVNQVNIVYLVEVKFNKKERARR